MCFGLAFRQLAPKYQPAFVIMAATVLASAVLSAFIHIKGHAGLLWGQDAPIDKNTGGTLAVPKKIDESEDTEEIHI